MIRELSLWFTLVADMAHLVTERKYPRKTSLLCDSFLRDVRRHKLKLG